MTDSSGFEARARNSVQASIATKQALLTDASLISAVAAAADALVNVFRKGRQVLLFGNGGSASDAQHITAELVGRFAFDRPALPAISLAEGLSNVTAIANDHGFDQVFARQLEALARPGDLAIAISTSGNSPNVLAGVAAAKKIGAYTVGLTGRSGGRLKPFVDVCLCIPSDDTPRIQECHILVGHILCEIVESELFKGHQSLPNP